jgi:hypothetical protein
MNPSPALCNKADLRRKLYHPAVQGGMIHIDAPLLQYFFQIAALDRVENLKEHRMQDNGFRELRSFEIAHTSAPRA